MMTHFGESEYFGKIVAVYLELRKAIDDGDQFSRGDDDLQGKLEEFIISIRMPKVLGDVLEYETDPLKWEGAIYLIERDASDIYEQIEGYIDVVIGGAEEMFTDANRELNGKGICEWIEANVPF